MWRHHLTVAARALARHRAYTAITIVGLAIGMAACLIILLFVRYETSYDASLPGAENVYQLQTSNGDPRRGERRHSQMAPYAAKAALEKDVSQVVGSVYALSGGATALVGGQPFVVRNALLVDGDYLRILRFPLVAGDARTALRRPGMAVLGRDEAVRLFGSPEVAMGRTLTLTSGGRTADYIVTGVADGPGRQSHARFDVIARIDLPAHAAEQPELLTSWGTQNGWLYVEVRPGTDVDAINASLPAWVGRNVPDSNSSAQRGGEDGAPDFRLVNVRDVHLGRAQLAAQTPGNDRRTIATFAVVALLILGMACVNFVNLATARASQRAREVALRKVLGASRGQLVAQFLFESVLLAALAMVLALTIVEGALPGIAGFLDADLAVTYLGDDGLLLPAIALVLVVGVAAGAYPAFVLSGFQPAHVLKANRSAADAHGSGRLRNVLVVGQFAVSIALIVCTAVVHAQTDYARTSDPGYEREGLIQIQAISRPQTWPMVDAFANEVARLDGVVAVGRTTLGIDTRRTTGAAFQLPGEADSVELGFYQVDASFFGTMGVRLLAGRQFDPARPADDATPSPLQDQTPASAWTRGLNVVANETAVRRLGFAQPRDAIGRTLTMQRPSASGGATPVTIIGVVRDARFRSIRDPLAPVIFASARTGHGAMLVRYRGDAAAVDGRIATVWKRMFPEVPYDGVFSEDVVGRLYAAEAARTKTFAGFSLLAVMIGCLGLLGLAAFTAERRTREIGIRKVLGARTRDIVQLLVWQFARPVLVANLIAWPIAWWVMRDWLNGFDDRIALTPLPFLLAGSSALLIAVATVAGHAWRVARASPVLALRHE